MSTENKSMVVTAFPRYGRWALPMVIVGTLLAFVSINGVPIPELWGGNAAAVGLVGFALVVVGMQLGGSVPSSIGAHALHDELDGLSSLSISQLRRCGW